MSFRFSQSKFRNLTLSDKKKEELYSEISDVFDANPSKPNIAASGEYIAYVSKNGGMCICVRAYYTYILYISIHEYKPLAHTIYKHTHKHMNTHVHTFILTLSKTLKHINQTYTRQIYTPNIYAKSIHQN